MVPVRARLAKRLFAPAVRISAGALGSLQSDRASADPGASGVSGRTTEVYFLAFCLAGPDWCLSQVWPGRTSVVALICGVSGWPQRTLFAACPVLASATPRYRITRTDQPPLQGCLWS